MAEAVTAGVFIIYIAPLLVCYFALFSSKAYSTESEAVRLLNPLTDQYIKIQGIIATIFVPLLTIYSVKITRDSAFDTPVFVVFAVLVTSFLLSALAGALTRSRHGNLSLYGADFDKPILGMLDHYNKESLIYIGIITGTSVGKATGAIPS